MAMSQQLAMDKWKLFLEETFSSLAAREAVVLDKVLEQERRHGSSWVSSRDKPKRLNVFSAATFVLGALFLFCFVRTSLRLAAPTTGQEFRLSLLQFSNGSRTSSVHNFSAVVGEAGLQEHNCVAMPVSEDMEGPHLLLRYGSDISVNAWFFSLAPGVSWQDGPMKFALQMMDNSGELRKIQQPLRCGDTSEEWSVQPMGEYEDEEHGYLLPLASTRWEQELVRLVEFAVATIGFWVACALSISHDQLRAWSCIRLTMALGLLCALVGAIVHSLVWGYKDGFAWWRDTYACAVLLVCLAPHARSMLDTALILVGVGYGALLLVDYIVVQGCLWSLTLTHEPTLALALIVAGLMLHGKHRRRVARLRKELQQDKEVMDATWAEVVLEPSTQDELQDLKVFTHLASSRLACRPQQRVETQSATGEPQCDTVQSLDQLYLQAKGAQKLLRDKVKTLSILSGGYLRAANLRQGAATQFLQWSEVSEAPCQDLAIDWSELKPTRRAVRKVVSRYEGDPSLLLDVCREMMSFSTVGTLGQCFRALASDPDVSIVRVKNRMLSRQAEEQGGLRYVLVNLTFVSEEARALALDGHVCELMLLHTSLSSKLTRQAHQRHLKLRALTEDRSVERLVSRFLPPGLLRLFQCSRARTQQTPPANLEVAETPLRSIATSFRRSIITVTRSHSSPSVCGSTEARKEHAALLALHGCASDGQLTSSRRSLVRLDTHLPALVGADGTQAGTRTLFAEEAGPAKANADDRGLQLVGAEAARTGSQGRLHSLWRLPELPPGQPDVDVASAELVFDVPRSSSLGWDSEEMKRGRSWGEHLGRAAPAVSSERLEAQEWEEAASDHQRLQTSERATVDSVAATLPGEATSAKGCGGDGEEGDGGGTAGTEQVGTATDADGGGMAEGRGGTSFCEHRGLKGLKGTQLMLPPSLSVEACGGPGSAGDGDGEQRPASGVEEDALDRTEWQLQWAQREGESFDMLLEQFRLAACTPPGQLDRRAMHPEVAYITAGSVSVVSSKHMLSACLCKKWARHILIAFIFLFLFLTLTGLVAHRGSFRFAAHCVRFNITQIRNGSAIDSAGAPLMAELGLLDSGCRVQLGRAWPAPAQSTEFESAEGWGVDGFYLVTGDHSGLDPVVFTLEASEACDGDWALVGASRRFVTVLGLQTWHAEAFDTPDERERLVEISLEHRWHFWFGFASDRAVYFVFSIVGWVLAVRKKPHLAITAAVTMQVVIFCCRLVSTVGAIAHHEYRDGRLPHQWVHNVHILLVTWLLVRSEGNVPFVLALSGVKQVAYWYLEQLHFNPTEAKFQFFNIGYVYALLGCVLLWLVHETKKRSETLIANDHSRYRRLWTEILAEPGTAQAVSQLERVVEAARIRIPADVGQRRWDLTPRTEEARSSGEGLGSQHSNGGGTSETQRTSHRSLDPLAHGGSGQSLADAIEPDVCPLRGEGGVSRETSTASAKQLSVTKVGAIRAAFHLNSAMSRQSSATPSVDASSFFGITFRGALFPQLAGAHKHCKPVTSLDQLYVQAAGLHPILIRKVKEWALESRGMFRFHEATQDDVRGLFLGEQSNSARVSNASVALDDTLVLEGSASSLSARQRPRLPFRSASALPTQRRHLPLSATSSTPGLHLRPSGRGSAGSATMPTPGVARAASAAVMGFVRHASSVVSWSRHHSPHATSAVARAASEARATLYRWEDVEGDEAMERLAVFAKLKAHDRAIEKLIRVYRGRVSALCDICRQSIYFDSVEDLLACMQTILADDQVVVKGIKNRLSLAYDDTLTAGYRDVNITLCIRSEETLQLLLDMHICEVQLILKDFASIKTAAGHRRYVAYRNMRAA